VAFVSQAPTLRLSKQAIVWKGEFVESRVDDFGREQIVVMSHKNRPLKTGVLASISDVLTVDVVSLDGNAKTQLDQQLVQATIFVLDYDSFSETVEMVWELRQRFPAEPILALTDELNEDRLLQAYIAGANDCISSTIGPALLLAKVCVWLQWAQWLRCRPAVQA